MPAFAGPRATVAAAAAQPSIELYEGDQTPPLGRWRWISSDGDLILQESQGTGGDFESTRTWVTYDTSAGEVVFNQPMSFTLDDVFWADDTFIEMGGTSASPDARMGYVTDDPNANSLVIELPTGGAVNVPVLPIGIGIIGVDLGLFNGITQPTLAMVDADRDSAFGMTWNADDVPQINFYGSAGNLDIRRAGNVLDVRNTQDADGVQVMIFEGDRATPANGDDAFVDLRLSDSGGTQDVVARIGWEATAVAAGAGFVGDLVLYASVAGAVTEFVRADGSASQVVFSFAPVPLTNDVAALGLATLGWADLFLASGALINVANGDAVITHSAGIFTVSTGDLRVTTAGTNTASVVTVGGSQTLTSKTLTSPIIGTQITLDQATADYTFTWADPAAARAISIVDPGGTDVFVWRDATQTLTSKTLTAPDINGGTADGLTSLGIRSTGTGAFDLIIANSENLTVSSKTLTVALNDANRTLTITANSSIGGTAYVVGGTDVALSDGGTNASLTANNGGIFYSTATAGAILAGTATAGQMLRSGATAAPTWSTATFPATATGTGTLLRADGTNWVASTLTVPDTAAISTILYASAANVISALATANSGVLVTSGTGVPSISSTLPAVTLGGTVSGGGNQINNVVIGAVTPLAGTFTTVTGTIFAASATAIGWGIAAPTERFWDVTPGDRTAAGSIAGEGFLLRTSTFTDNATAGSGTIAGRTYFVIDAPTMVATNASVTITDAATFRIIGVPIEGTNVTMTRSSALWIQSASGSTPVTLIGIKINTLSGATSANYALSIGSTDADQNLIHVGVTGDPIFSWDESDDAFEMNKGLELTAGDLRVGLSTATSGASGGFANGIAIGADADANQFDDASNGAASTQMFIGNASINTTSDVRVKARIEDYEGDALGLIRQMRVVEHDYLDAYRPYGGGVYTGRYVGLIAQDLYEVTPWLVNTQGGKDCWECRAGLECELHNPWMVKFDLMVPVLVAGMQQFDTRIDALEDRFGEQETEVEKLQRELADAKRRIKELEEAA